jgi:hypothetical protein
MARYCCRIAANPECALESRRARPRSPSTPLRLHRRRVAPAESTPVTPSATAVRRFRNPEPHQSSSTPVTTGCGPGLARHDLCSVRIGAPPPVRPPSAPVLCARCLAGSREAACGRGFSRSGRPDASRAIAGNGAAQFHRRITCDPSSGRRRLRRPAAMAASFPRMARTVSADVARNATVHRARRCG